MPLFFFDLVTPARVERDSVGLQFISLDEAYLSASQAALEISIEMLRQRENPSRHRFEVRDEHGYLVMELPFLEVLQPGRVAKPRDPSEIHERLKTNLARNRVLKAELAATLAKTRQTLYTTLALRELALNAPSARNL